MGLSFNSNLTANIARNNLVNVQGDLDQSISRLSSGLRINSAADDPSGLSISQRLHTQLKGLNRAVMNSQDAISYLQTAESSLAESQNILQRMRELAVQAANGTLTANDRTEIQKEIDQLGEEVDRIAKTTEFNTKKLLDGSATALWSTSSEDVNLIIRGAVDEGNYELEIDTEPIPNHVLKTDIFSLKSAAIGVDNVKFNETNASVTLSDSNAAGNAGTVTFDFGLGTTYDLAVDASIDTPTKMVTLINNNKELDDYVLAYVDGSGNLAIKAKVGGDEGNIYSVHADNTNVGGFPTTSIYYFSGGVDYPAGVVDIGDPDGLPSSEDINGTYAIYVDNQIQSNGAVNTNDSVTVVGSYEQPMSSDIPVASTPNALSTAIISACTDALGNPTNVTAHEGSGYAIIEITKGDTVDNASTSDEIYAKVSFDNGSTWVTTTNLALNSGLKTITSPDGKVSFAINDFADGTTLNRGDKLLIALNDLNYNSGDHAALRVDTPFKNGTSDTAIAADINTQTGPVWAFAVDGLNNTTTTVDVGYIDTDTGDISFGSIDVKVGNLASNSATSVDVDEEFDPITFDVIAGSGEAFRTTKLWQIDKFYDSQGNFILGENGKSLTINNSMGTTTTIYIDPEDTIGEVADKIEQAISSSTADGGLGMGTGDALIDNHIADYVSEATPLSDEAVKGTIVIRSPQMGPKGKLYFSGDESLLNALSLVTIQDTDHDPMTVTVKDAHTGKIIGEDTVADNILRNVVSGVDIELNPNLDIDVSWDTASKRFVFENATGTVKEYIHVVNNAKSFQVGSNEGQTIDSYISEMTAHALGVDNILVNNQTLAQSSITKLDEAIDAVSSERSKLGSLINRLEHTINNLTVQAENAYASESRIKDLDIAQETTELSKNQILSQAAMSMLAQANSLPQNLLSLLKS